MYKSKNKYAVTETQHYAKIKEGEKLSDVSYLLKLVPENKWLLFLQIKLRLPICEKLRNEILLRNFSVGPFTEIRKYMRKLHLLLCCRGSNILW